MLTFDKPDNRSTLGQSDPSQVPVKNLSLSFCSFKPLGVFLLFVRWDAVQLQSYTQHLIEPLTSIYMPGWREALQEWSVLHKNICHPITWPGLEPGLLDPESSVLNTPHLTVNFNWQFMRFTWFFTLKLRPLSDNLESTYRHKVIPDVLPINTIEKRVSFDFIDVIYPFIRITAPSERWAYKTC